MSPHDPRARPPAIVIGLCAHGLSLVRSLARAGVEVHALEGKAHLPGLRTRRATVHRVRDINRDVLLEDLLALPAALGERGAPVLFPTNDHVVRILADGFERLRGRFRLTWAEAAPTVRRYLDKRALEQRCVELGMHYPRTVVLTEHEDAARVAAEVRFPLIVKPARPLSAFKVLPAADADALHAILRRFPDERPLLLQEWIEGGDTALLFGALYLDGGRVRARFEGRKLRSYPRARGGTTVAESAPDDRVHAETVRFFEGLGITGPVSLEVKRAPDGTLWVIEPTVGRTDYWLPVCIANGVDFPRVEYAHAVGEDEALPVQHTGGVWIDVERDPGALAAHAGAVLASLLPGRSVAWPYLDLRDPGPSLRGIPAWLGAVARWGRERLSRRRR